MKRIDHIASLPLKQLIAASFIRSWRKAKNKLTAKRFVWQTTNVSNSLFPDADLRNYYEHKNIREMLGFATDGGLRLTRACEIGCGYGRVIPVLREFADEVTGFERESHLCHAAQCLVRDVKFINLENLEDFVSYGMFNLIMTCTVVQHHSDADAERLLDKIKSHTDRSGFVLLIESTDVSHLKIIGNKDRGDKFLSRPRSVEEYEGLMQPFKLVKSIQRTLELAYPGNAGSCMLFRNVSAT